MFGGETFAGTNLPTTDVPLLASARILEGAELLLM